MYHRGSGDVASAVNVTPSSTIPHSIMLTRTAVDTVGSIDCRTLIRKSSHPSYECISPLWSPLFLSPFDPASHFSSSLPLHQFSILIFVIMSSTSLNIIASKPLPKALSFHMCMSCATRAVPPDLVLYSNYNTSQSSRERGRSHWRDRSFAALNTPLSKVIQSVKSQY